MTRYLALYCGPTVEEAVLVKATTDPRLVGRFASAILSETEEPLATADPVVGDLERGRRRALRRLVAEGQR